MKTLNLSYFDNDFGAYDEFNPRFVFSNKNAKLLIDILSNKNAFFYSKTDLIKLSKLSDSKFNETTKLLDNISAIVIENEKFRLNFPFFTAKDILFLKNLIEKEIQSNFNFFVSQFNELEKFAKNLYPNIDSKVTLYHLLCGKLFDGKFFNYLEQQDLLKAEYPKKDDRDYVIIGYQNTVFCNRFNNSLLCSFNNARFEKNSLTSFGTPHNNRLDYFRYFKLRESNKLPIKFLKLHKFLSNTNTSTIVKNSISLINYIKNKKIIKDNCLVKALIETKYISKKYHLRVPVFDDYVKKIEELYNLVVKLFGNDIIKSLRDVKEKVSKSQISCILHGVNIDEICNELWHIYFGTLNKYFVKHGLVCKPKRYITEGSYLKCVYVND